MAETASVDEGRLVAGRYRLLERIGQGGMGTVWRARDEVLGRQVAVKRLHVSPQLDADELATRHERTTREAQAAARINHPNVVSVHDVVDDEGLPCIVMEYVPSTTLGDAIKKAARTGTYLAPREAARIGRGMIAALRAAHSAGVLHRDVKPGNVLLGEEGRVVLTDFGIAVATGASTLTKTGELVGSIDYLAPERVKGGTPGPASDLWALGATLYQAVEGKPPFRKPTAVETAYAIAVDPVEPPRNAGQLGPLIEALLAKEPGDRPTAEVVEQALRAAEAEAETALMGWPTLALGTVARDRSATDDASEAPTHPVASAAAPAATGRDTSDGTGYGTGQGTRTATATGTTVGNGTAGHTAPGPATGVVRPPAAPTAAGEGTVPVAAPPGAVTGTTAGTGTDVLTAGGPAPRRRRGKVVAWSIAGVLVAGGGAGAAWYVTHRDTGTAQKSAADTGTPVVPGAPRASIGPPPPLPEGYRQVTEKDLGVTFPVPADWKRQVLDGGRQIVYYSDADLARLTLNALDFSSADQVEHFKSVESDLKVQYPSYKRLRLQDTIFQGDPAAIWEFSFQGRVREYRGIDLGFGREGGKEYAIYVSAPSANWPKFEQVFTNVKDGFRRTAAG
ncbi:serine/threonine protein kinase [Streptomyces sp. NRRL F-4489]|uniref:serine/threonine-protein kinase n=1 Tax=Streptomyces sp. NRRL F-4489 TaxID=1609095 RepID=UPI000749A7FE|nr:serine/threonine-protein kinase [Streptomyces sp. NRRL F-4489]KUL54074.1 serine/threonine protein kinase [Streptomyces sp. NRRL F-4489]